MARGKGSLSFIGKYFKKLKSFISLEKIRKNKFIKKFNKLNRNVKLASVLVLILLVVGLISFLSTKADEIPIISEVVNTESDALEETDSITANVTLTQGSLQIKNEDSEWENYTAESEIGEGTSFKTSGATSRTVIAFDDGCEVRLDGNSELELQELTVERIVVRLVDGYVYNRVVPNKDMTYVVTTDDAQFEALGTAFRVGNTGDEQAVEVFHSSVIETSTNTTTREGEKLVVIDNQRPSNNGTIEKLDIERIKNDSFIKWNKDLDKENDSFKNSLGFLSDFEAPEINLDVSDGDTILLDPSAEEGTVQITGTTEKDAELTVTVKSVENAGVINVSVGDDGKFTTPVLTAPLGDATIEFVAKDKTGNTTTDTVRITFQRKSGSVGGQGIVLFDNGSDSEDVNLAWSVSGLDTSDGFRVIYSNTNTDPTFGVDTADPVSTGTNSYSKKKSNFNTLSTYYFKVCVYDNETASVTECSEDSVISVFID